MPTSSELAGLLERQSAPGKCLVIGEVAQSHDGSLGLAHAFVDAIADAGADAVKFQMHIAAAESTPEEPWRVRFSRQDSTRYDYWRRMEFTEEQWRGLRIHAEQRGLFFLCSPFSIEAVEILLRIGVPGWKIASGELRSDTFRCALHAGRPILLSTGLSGLADIDAAVAEVRARQLPLAVLQCTSCYPCPPEKIGLNLLAIFRARYGCAVGLSDHSGTIYPALAAATLGADVLEVHVTLSRDMFGPDVPSSVTTAELRQLVEGVRVNEVMRQHAVDKDHVAADLSPIRQMFTKSLVAAHDLQAGTILDTGHLIAKKPGTGIPADRIGEIVGRRLKRDLHRDHLLATGDLD